MPVSASTLKMLMDGGFAGEALLAVVASIDADMAIPAPSTPVRLARQERNARYYDGQKERLKASEKRLNKTSYETPPSPTPPTSNPTPLSPPKGDSSPLPEYPSADAAGKPIETWVEEIWLATPTKGRQRSGKAQLRRTLVAAVRRGSPPEAIAAGLRAYYASPDATKGDREFAKGVHRIVEDDRWAEWAAAMPVRAISPTAWPDDRWIAAVDRWRMVNHWPPDIGPSPDHPATLVPEHLRPQQRTAA